MAAESRSVVLMAVCAFVLGFSLSPAETGSESDGGDRLLFETKPPSKIVLRDIIFIVLTQANRYHAERARVFKQDFRAQLKALKKKERPKLFLSHEKWPTLGTWTVFPLLAEFAEHFSKKAWIFVCEEETRIDLLHLLEIISKYDHTKPVFLGKALRDRTPVIIHHFAFAENPGQFKYPDFAAGFLMSLPLVRRLVEMWPPTNIRTDFSIDPKHEGGAVSKDDLFVAVKTCEKFHKERVPVVKATWAKETEQIEFFSEKEDPSIPTINVGVPNTERGHCQKTFNILRRALEESHIASKPWLLIVDDDTIISITRLRKLLACYNADEPVALGERYGYGASTQSGYDYITGGGGMVFSHTAVRQIINSGQCHCVRDDSPDDMTLGICLRTLSIPVTHTPFFHQARPNDYAPEFLEHHIPISFHKHWMTDPKKVYEKWFASDAFSHDEL